MNEQQDAFGRPAEGWDRNAVLSNPARTEHGDLCIEDPAGCPDQVTCPVLANMTLDEVIEIDHAAREAEAVAWEAERIAYEAEIRQLGEKARDEAERELTSWAPVDLGAVLDGGVSTPQPTILSRTDGQCFLYPARTHSFVGESEHGKTLAAFLACSQELLAGRGVVYVDFEGEASDFVRWMLSLGVSAQTIRKRSRYIRPDSALDEHGRRAVRRACIAVQPSLVVFDGVTEAMMLHDLNDNKGIDTAAFMNMFPRQFEKAGVTALLIDHAPHGGDRAIGSQHKRSAVTGASYLFVKRSVLRPGHPGKVDITILKDRPGQVRGASPNGESAGTLHIEPLPEVPDRIGMSIEPPGQSVGVPLGAMERVSLYLEQHPGDSPRKTIERDVPGDGVVNLAALDLLVGMEYVSESLVPHGQRTRRFYASLKPFRAGQD